MNTQDNFFIEDGDGFKNVDWEKLNNLYLSDEQLENCKVFSSRDKILEVLPKNGICAELGVANGVFSHQILGINKPKKLILVDIMLQKELPIEPDVVELIEGDSVEVMNQFEDNYFDWIYIDTDHTEEQTNKELQVCKNKIKYDGYIGLDDYIQYVRLGNNKYNYGVVDSVNNFLIENQDFEVVYLSLEPTMFNTIFLRRKQ
tara:strand:+ start:1263 stop:1868 length:606 start_codon:yes stop_codon:yes gene_type:complete